MKPTRPGGRIEWGSKKKSRQDRMTCSKTFETQEVREIGEKEAGESRGFPILWMGIIEEVFQTEKRSVKTRKD